MTRWICLQVFCWTAFSVCAADEIQNPDIAVLPDEIAANEGKVRAAVIRSLPFLKSGGVAWILVETPFKSLDEFRRELATLVTEQELKSYESVIIKTAERALNAPDRSGGGLDVLGQLLLSGHGSTSDLQKPEFRDGVTSLMEQLQRSDGSWITASKNISNTTDPERLKARDEIYHYWGTAWATLGLLESLAMPSGS